MYQTNFLCRSNIILLYLYIMLYTFTLMYTCTFIASVLISEAARSLDIILWCIKIIPVVPKLWGTRRTDCTTLTPIILETVIHILQESQCAERIKRTWEKERRKTVQSIISNAPNINSTVYILTSSWKWIVKWARVNHRWKWTNIYIFGVPVQ